MIKLGLNIDHIATIRNARGGNHPDIVYAAKFAKKCGADSITVHLREDRWHIKDIDVGYSDDLILPEEVGLSLIPYKQEVSDAIINYVIGGDLENQAHTLSLDDSGNISYNIISQSIYGDINHNQILKTHICIIS